METSVELPALPKSAGEARRFAGHLLSEWHIRPETCDVVVLLVSELVTNAILHAGLKFSLSLQRVADNKLRAEVRDPSPVPVQPRHFTTEAGTGRGYMLIEALAVDWGWDSGPDGKVVWFEVAA